MDEETGLYYFGARYYQQSWSVWLSVDPLTEDYQSWSPYNYTMNNPVMLIDPDGRSVLDIYKLNQNGSIEFVEKSKGPDVLYATDDNGKIDKTQSIEISNKKLLPQLENNLITDKSYHYKDKTLKGSYAISQDHKGTKELFEWIASNNSNEWSYIKGISNNETYSFVGTLRSIDQGVDLERSVGFGEYETIIDVHSHYGKTLDDFRASGSDESRASRIRDNSPNAKFFIYSPLYTKENYNNAVKGKMRSVGNKLVPFKLFKYEPKSKYISY